MELSQNLTIVLYISIFTISTILMNFSQKTQYEYDKTLKIQLPTVKFRLPYFLAAIFTLWLFLFFSNIGPDYDSYALLISRITWQNYSSFFDLEPLFNLLLLLIKGICGDSIALTIALIKTLTVIIVGISFYIRRNHTNLTFGFFCYILWCYLPSFYLLPMILATSIIMLACAIMSQYKKKIIPLCLVILAAQIHNSVYIYLLVFIASLFVGKVDKLSKMKRFFVIIAYLSVAISATSIFLYASTFISNFHYGGYIIANRETPGFLFIIMYAPLFYICFRVLAVRKDAAITNLIFLYILTSALIKITSYSFTVIGRVEYLLIPLYSNYFAEFAFKNPNVGIGRKKTTLFGLLIIVYILFRGWMNFSSELEWMGIYRFFNPFIQ